jgi:host factor-I protein
VTEPHKNLQDRFLGHLKQHKTPATVFLTNGVKLQGIVAGFDASSLLLRRESHAQLVYKHAISTIMPNEPVNLGDHDEAGADPA